MEITKTSSTTYYSVVDKDEEYTVVEMYDANSDSTTYSIINVNSDEELGEDDCLFNEILNELSEQF